MTTAKPDRRPSNSSQTLPWYRYPWPWVAIAIPAVAVVGGMFTLYLAITNPDPLIVDDQKYEDLRSNLQAQPLLNTVSPAPVAERDDADGDG